MSVDYWAGVGVALLSVIIGYILGGIIE